MAASALMNVMVSAARKAGRSLARDFGEVETASGLGQGAGEFRLRRRPQGRGHHLRRSCRRRGRAMASSWRERGLVEGDDQTYRWIVDPLDGTTNFLHGIPHFAISIGLEREGTLAAGVVYNPATDELFAAEKGKGAFLNDKRRLSRRRPQDTCRCCRRDAAFPHRGPPRPPRPSCARCRASCVKWRASAARAPPHSISPTPPQAASTAAGNAT